MKHTCYLFKLTMLVGILTTFFSCSEEKTDSVSMFLDVNVQFTNKDALPKEGQTLVAKLYYKDVLGCDFNANTPNVQIDTVLTSSDVQSGLRITFENIDTKQANVYVALWVDVNGNGSLDKGDLASFNGGVKVEDVEDFVSIPANLAGEYVISENLGTVYKADEFIVPEGYVADVDKNLYKKVVIGTQTWLGENLRTTHFRNGDDINAGYTSNTDALWIATWLDKTAGTGTPAYSQNSAADLGTDGLYYNFFAASDSRGLCPDGYRVPTDDDWCVLEAYAGVPEADLRTSSTSGAWRGDGAATKLKSSLRDFLGEDTYGFCALPSGWRDKANGAFALYNQDSYFWTSTTCETNIAMGWERLFRNSYTSINRKGISKVAGNSIRCVKE